MPEVKDWIAKAISDLKSSKKLMTGDDETLDTAAYHTQQTAEKALKAYLFFKQQTVPKTHDLPRLLEYCVKYDSTFKHLQKDAEILTVYVTYARYPDDRFNVERQEVIEAIKMAEKILKFVQTKIEPTGKNPQLTLFDS